MINEPADAILVGFGMTGAVARFRWILKRRGIPGGISIGWVGYEDQFARFAKFWGSFLVIVHRTSGFASFLKVSFVGVNQTPDL